MLFQLFREGLVGLRPVFQHDAGERLSRAHEGPANQMTPASRTLGCVNNAD